MRPFTDALLWVGLIAILFPLGCASEHRPEGRSEASRAEVARPEPSPHAEPTRVVLSQDEVRVEKPGSPPEEHMLAPVKTDSFTGTIEALQADAVLTHLILKTRDPQKSIPITCSSARTSVRLHGKEARLTDLRVGQEVTIICESHSAVSFPDLKPVIYRVAITVEIRAPAD